VREFSLRAGTLAVITKIILRLIPKPRMKVDLLAPFDDLGSAARAVSAILAERTVPTAIEFMDQAAIGLAEKYLRRSI
jgi:glycolate oxidase